MSTQMTESRFINLVKTEYNRISDNGLEPHILVISEKLGKLEMSSLANNCELQYGTYFMGLRIIVSSKLIGESFKIITLSEFDSLLLEGVHK